MMIPDLDALSDLMSIISRWEQDGSPLDALLQTALPALPGVRALHLCYVLDGAQQLVAVAGNDNSSVIWQADLIYHGQPYAVLEVVGEGALSSSTQFAVKTLANALERQIVDALISRHAQISAELTTCSTFIQMVEIMGRRLLSSGEYILIHLLQYASDGELVGFRTIVNANRHQASPIERSSDATYDLLGPEILRSLKQGEPILIYNVPDNPHISPRFKNWSSGKPIQSACIMPIRFDGRVQGVVNINTVGHPLIKSSVELTLLQLLVDHIGSILHSQLMLQESQQVQTAASRLIETNRSIAAAQDYDEMAQIVLDSLPPIVASVAITLFDKASTQESLPDEAVLQAMVTRKGREVINNVRDDLLSARDRFAPFFQRFAEAAPVIIEDNRQLTQPIMKNVIALLQKDEVYGMISVGLRSGDYLLGILMLGLPAGARLNENQLENVVLVADQTAAAIESRTLSLEREQALEESQLLYDINSQLLEAVTSLDVLRVVRKYLAQDATSVMLYSYGWDEMNDEIVSIITEAVIDANGEAEPKTELIDLIPPEMMRLLREDRDQMGSAVDFIEDYETVIGERPALKIGYDMGIRAGVAVPVYNGDYYILQVAVHYYDHAQPFDERTRRLYEATRDQLTIILENRRLLQSTQQVAASLGNQVRILQIINQLAGDLTNTTNEQALMDKACQSLVSALDVDHASITLMDDSETFARIVSEYPEQMSVGAVVPLDNPIQIALREQHQPVIVVDVETDPRLDAALRPMLQQMNIQSIAFIPILDARLRYVGAVTVESRNPNKQLDTGIIDVARTITAQMGVALENIRLLRSTQRQARQLEGIVGFGQAIQAVFDIPVLLEVALIHVIDILPIHHVAVMLYDAAKGQLRTVAIEDESANVRVDMDGDLPDVTATTAERVWKTKSPLQVHDLHKADNLRYVHSDEIQSVISLPIMVRGAAIGVIEAGNRQVGAYNNVDAAVFQQLVGQLAVAIENAETYTQSQRLAKSKALVNEITSQLQRQTDIEQLLNVTMRELGQALGAKRGRIRFSADNLTNDRD